MHYFEGSVPVASINTAYFAGDDDIPRSADFFDAQNSDR